jgi:hypothetical protein
MPTITPAVISGTGALAGKYNVRIVADPIQGLGGAPIYADVQILFGPSGASAVAVTPDLDIIAYGGNGGEVFFPTPTVSGAGSVGQAGDGAVAIGGLEVEGFAGGNTAVDVCGLAIEAQATVQQVGHGLVTLDRIEVLSTGTQHNKSVLSDITFPAVQVSGHGYQDGSGRGDVTFPELLVLGTGEVGPVGECLVAIEYEGLPTIEASGWTFALAQGDITIFPAMVIAAQGQRPNHFTGLILRYEDEYQP